MSTTISRVLLSFVLLSVVLVPKDALSAPQVPCYFIFGDSLTDPGNNNFLVTWAKANFPPYGVDFSGRRATGRFTNNKTIVDIIASRLGFPDFIPGYLEAQLRPNFLRGVNYASGAAGIRDESGRNQGARFSLREQVRLHGNIVDRLSITLKNHTAALKYLNRCVYTLGLGSNDYINNYFMPESYTSSNRYNTTEFAKLIVGEYEAQLTTLYEIYGARKMALLGVGPVGFTPYELGRYGVAEAPRLNAAVELFNVELKSLVGRLNADLRGATFTFLNTTGIVLRNK